MIDLVQNIIAAIAPPIFVVYYVYKNDKYEKEPRKLVIKTLLLGCLVVIPVLLLSLDKSFYSGSFSYALIGVALFEEGFKFLFLRAFIYKKSDFNEPYDGILYAVVISMGFALVENVFYVIGNEGREIGVAFLRMFTAIPLHATCGVIMGYFVGKTKMVNEKKSLILLIGLLTSILIHGLYDYFLFEGLGILYSLLVLIIAIYLSNKAIKTHQENSSFKLKNEV